MNGKGNGSRGAPDASGIAIALGLIVIAGAIAWDASQLRSPSPYGLGPDAMPYVVAAGLGLLGLANLVIAGRGALPHRERGDLLPIFLILGGLVALMAIIGLGGGFIAGTAVLFAATATAFGRRAILTDLAIGAVVALVAYLLFAKLLSLSLPMGPIERLF